MRNTDTIEMFIVIFQKVAATCSLCLSYSIFFFSLQVAL